MNQRTKTRPLSLAPSEAQQRQAQRVETSADFARSMLDFIGVRVGPNVFVEGVNLALHLLDIVAAPRPGQELSENNQRVQAAAAEGARIIRERLISPIILAPAGSSLPRAQG